MNQPNQSWHYPGPVDTVSTVMKIQVLTPNLDEVWPMR